MFIFSLATLALLQWESHYGTTVCFQMFVTFLGRNWNDVFCFYFWPTFPYPNDFFCTLVVNLYLYDISRYAVVYKEVVKYCLPCCSFWILLKFSRSFLLMNFWQIQITFCFFVNPEIKLWKKYQFYHNRLLE